MPLEADFLLVNCLLETYSPREGNATLHWFILINLDRSLDGFPLLQPVFWMGFLHFFSGLKMGSYFSQPVLVSFCRLFRAFGYGTGIKFV